MVNEKTRIKRLYWVWAAMIQRCKNPKNKAYKNYGGRGISVSLDWYCFDNFYKDMGLPEQKMTLERIDNDGNYCKENCIWSDRFVQAANRRYARKIIIEGVHDCIKNHWRKHSPEGLCYRRVMRRINELGWDIERAIKTKPRPIKNV